MKIPSFLLHLFEKKEQRSSKKGFTLVEMVVVLAIMGIITGVAITGQSAYNKGILLTDTTYSVALSLRQAQTYGLSSRRAGVVQNAGFGINLNRSDLSRYRLFADINRLSPIPPVWCPTGVGGTPEAKPGNCIYTIQDNPVIQTFSFTRGFTIERYCGKRRSDGVQMCAYSAPDIAAERLDIVFVRPNTKTIMTAYNSLNGYHELTCALIYIKDPAGTLAERKVVRVSSLGEISVGNASMTCP